MSRLVDGLVIGGLVAGVVWYTRRDRAKAQAATRTAERLVALAEAGAGSSITAGRTDRDPLRPASSPATPVAAADARAPAAPALTRRFDDLFRQHGQGLPVAYLRALAHAESGLNPDDPKGLLNVVPIALADYNRRHTDAPLKPEQMRDPAKNVQVAADILREIMASYERNHGDVRNLRSDWTNRAFVELLTLSWNGGYSERAGVGRVVRYLKSQPSAKPSDITIDTVFAAARAAGAAEHLSNPRKLAYAKGVAAAFLREVERDLRESSATGTRVA